VTAATTLANALSILDEVYDGLENGSFYPSMNRLRTGLSILRDDISLVDWRSFCECTMSEHPIQQVLRESPIPSHRGRSRLRQALDCRSLDLICGRSSNVPDTTVLGKMLYGWEYKLPFSEALRVREAVFRSELSSIHQEQDQPRVLLLTHHSAGTQLAGSFDFIHASHLFDSLGTEQARALVGKLADALAPNGRLFIANTAPEVPDAGYLEACLNYWPNYRSEEEMARLVDAVPDKRISSQCVFRDESGYSVFLELQKSVNG
jgi:extracellular factor (EF) 3-hydroxypalmitic acid methyl ester biosynthesis protein